MSEHPRAEQADGGARDDGAHHAQGGRTARFIARKALWVLALTAALTLLAISQLFDLASGQLRVHIDPSLDPLIAQDDPGRAYYEQVRHRFGNDETVLVVLQSADIYSADSLGRLDRLTQGLAELPGVAEVTSLINTPLARASQGEISFESLDAGVFDDPQLAGRLRAAVAGNPLVRGHLVSADGRATAVVVKLEAQTDSEMLEQATAEKITGVADAEATADVKIRVTGAPVIRAATSEAVLKQLRWVVPAIVVLLTVLLALAFRSLRGVLLPLTTIALALTWTLATLCVLDRPLNLITSLVPPLLVTMGLAYCAHILSEFESLPAGLSGRERVERLLHEVSAPVLLTGITTIAGLLALAIGALPATVEFSWLSALGVFYTVVLALTFMPAALRLAPARKAGSKLPASRLFEEGSRRIGAFDMQNRKTILAAAALVFLAAVAASSQIRVGDQFVGIFPPESRVRADYEAVNQALGGVSPLSIVIDGTVADTFTNPKILRELERLQDWLAAQPEVGAVSGLVDHVKLLNANMATSSSGVREIPQSAELIKQMLFFADAGVLRGVVDRKRASTLISLRLKVDDTADISLFLDRLQGRLAELPEGLKAQVTGNSALLVQSVETATSGQVYSVGLALLLVYLCLAIQFTSWGVGLLACLPTILQTALYFGALGLSGISLNATTSLVECLVLGLAVDDTIHYLARFNSEAKRSGSESNAAVSALAGVLRPITLTKGMLALGFLVLATGDLHNQVVFGWLVGVMLFTAWLVDVFVTPAFMSRVRIVTLWDSLVLDLGRNVQATMPLFAGLSTRQARIFALMSKMQVVPAGTRIITEGDPAGDVFVVVEGELSVSVMRDNARLPLNTLRRGAVVGEGGYFGQRRNADVDAVTRVRLLRFDDADQERICRRYPAIAARVFLNLSKIQAERHARQMQLAH